jgi:hypothetical protein
MRAAPPRPGPTLPGRGRRPVRARPAQGRHSLAGQLKQIAAEGALDATLTDWADHIRVLGNAGAHPNTLAPVSVDEAEELARLLPSLLDYLYVMPARVQRARADRP